MRDPVDIKVIYQTHTKLAVCVREAEEQPDVWLPLSQIDVDDLEFAERGEVVELTGPEWLLAEKGLL